ncbi:MULTISPECIES: response regulator transcription factor [unclassified Chamaesiphon]|uniref:response regulator n=1 Tax=unclassified Chamaesiphon TaxID=2620921 RepID=UPI00286B8BD2|nr:MULTISPECIES: response regulator transcription factor [unclassified Chamaesiphon]
MKRSLRQAKDDELRKSEELYRSLFEISSEGIYRWELDRPVSLSLSVDEQAVDLYQQHQPDVTLMDLQMPKLEGAAAIAQIRTNDPDARIIVLTTYDGDVDIYRGLQAGARGYLLKDTTAKELLNAVRSVHQGQREIAPTVALKLAERVDRADALTERELAVLRLLVKVIRSDIANETTAPNFATNHDHPY